MRSTLDRDDAFRARVAAGVDEAGIGRASWLFLTRPQGWEDEFELLSAAAAERRADEASSRGEQRAERRVGHLEENLDRLREELAALQRSLATAEDAAAVERRARARAEQERAELHERVESLESQRARAVRSLKETESTAAARLDELKELRRQLADAQEAARPPADAQPGAPEVVVEESGGIDRDAVVAAVARAGDAAASLAEALTEVASLIAVPSGSDPPPAAVEEPDRSRPERPPRRTPVRLRQGHHEDSPDGLEQLLATQGIKVLVDGYNVSQSGWANLDVTSQRDSLVAALGVLRTRTGADVHVVFDGDADGSRPAVHAPLPVRVHFSPAEVEADDLILSLVAELPTDVPVAVVSSDRRVADGARRLGANAVRSETLLALLRR